MEVWLSRPPPHILLAFSPPILEPEGLLRLLLQGPSPCTQLSAPWLFCLSRSWFRRRRAGPWRRSNGPSDEPALCHEWAGLLRRRRAEQSGAERSRSEPPHLQAPGGRWHERLFFHFLCVPSAWETSFIRPPNRSGLPRRMLPHWSLAAAGLNLYSTERTLAEAVDQAWSSIAIYLVRGREIKAEEQADHAGHAPSIACPAAETPAPSLVGLLLGR